MRLYGLIGFPLTHSFSKNYFSEKFEKEGIHQCVYENFPIPVMDDLKKIISLPGISGLNVTIPYKEQVIPFLHQASDLVIRINACNCIKITGGKLFGYNSDIAGFRNSLSQTLSCTVHKQALILGTGGSAKAVKYVLEKMGIPFKSVSRKPSADCLSYEQVTGDMIRSHTLIINTTPLGLFPDVLQMPAIPYQFLTKDHFLFDLIYNPGKTLFLKKGEEMGALIQNGYDMLQLQAEESWKIWNTHDDFIDQ